VTLRVVDQDEQWVDDQTAGETFSQSSIDYAPTAAGDPISQLGRDARRAMEATSGDVVEHAGYPRQEPIEYRLVRDGRVVALARYASTGHGRWLLDGVQKCD
jgi:hypothetical protein